MWTDAEIDQMVDIAKQLCLDASLNGHTDTRFYPNQLRNLTCPQSPDSRFVQAMAKEGIQAISRGECGYTLDWSETSRRRRLYDNLKG